MILCLETSAPLCQVGLASKGELKFHRSAEQINRHSELLHTYIDEILLEAGIQVSELEAVAYSAGPGSYTGLRIGPMIDAGRMEVYWTIYDGDGVAQKIDEASVVDKVFFEKLGAESKFYYGGNGSEKVCPIADENWQHISGLEISCSQLALVTYKKFIQKEYANLAYCKPNYVKRYEAKKPSAII